MRTLTLQGRHEKATSKKGQQRVELILNAARDILVEQGYTSLSMRKIAARAGITVGNLSYYYSSKRDLVHDLLEAVIQGYIGWWDEIMADETLTPEQQFTTIVSFIMEDLTTKETTHFFPELWVLANHDPFAQQSMEDMYRYEWKMLAEMIRRLNPALDEQDRKTLAAFITASMEGHTVFMGHKRFWSKAAKELTNIAVRSFLHMIKTATPQNIHEYRLQTA